MQFPSFSLILSGLFIGYVLHSIWTLAQLFIPPSCQPSDLCIRSYLSNKPDLQLYIFTSVNAYPVPKNEAILIENIKHFNYLEPTDRNFEIELPEQTKKNGTLYLHSFLTPQSNRQQQFYSLAQDDWTVHTRVKLTQYHVPEAATYQLLGTEQQDVFTNSAQEDRKERRPSIPVTHIKTRVTFNILTDEIAFPSYNIPPELVRLVR